MNLISFLAEAKDIVGYMGTTFQVIGSMCALFLWIPPIMDVFKLNKTYGLSEKFILFGVVSGMLFSLSGLWGVVEGSLGTTNIMKILFNGISLCLNIFSGTTNFLFLGRKRTHMREAEEKGLSEMDYYNTYLAK